MRETRTELEKRERREARYGICGERGIGRKGVCESLELRFGSQVCVMRYTGGGELEDRATYPCWWSEEA